MEIQPRSTAIVLVDLQTDVLDSIERATPNGTDVVAALITSTQRLLEFGRRHDMPAFWVKVERRPDLLDQAELVTGLVRAGVSRPPREARALIQDTDGARLAAPLKPAETDDIVVKKRVSGFHGTVLDTLLRARRLRTLLLGGVNTEMGVESTARSAWDHDYHCVVVADCCASTKRASHEHALAHTLPRFAEVCQVDDLVPVS